MCLYLWVLTVLCRIRPFHYERRKCTPIRKYHMLHSPVYHLYSSNNVQHLLLCLFSAFFQQQL